MASGVIDTTLFIAFSSLSPNTVNRSAQCFIQGLPPKRDVGYVTVPTFITLWLWNGSTSDAVLSSIIGDEESEGMTWNDVTPLVVHSKESTKVIIEVGILGPLVFSGNIVFTSSCNIITLNVFGTRAPQLSGDVGYLFFDHNWENGLTETLEWMTDVLIAHDRTEQRIQLRSIPRRSWEFRFLLEGNVRRKMESWMSMRKTRFLFSPICRDVVLLSGDVVAGSSTIPITITQRSENLIEDTDVALWTNENQYEIRKITGVGSSYISVDAPFESDYFANHAHFAPCRYFMGTGQRTVNRATDDIGDFVIRAVAINDKWLDTTSDATLYNGYGVCPFDASFDSGAEDWENKWVVLDNNTGILSYDMNSIEPVISRDARFLVEGTDEIELLMRFLRTRSGKLVPFYIPSTDTSFELATSSLAVDQFIVIKGIGYQFAFEGSAVRSHIKLELHDGTILYRKINSVETLPSGDEKFVLNEVLGVVVSQYTLAKASWLELVRLDTDSVSLKWVNTELVELTIPIVSLP